VTVCRRCGLSSRLARSKADAGKGRPSADGKIGLPSIIADNTTLAFHPDW
jgi:hypothetical protein